MLSSDAITEVCNTPAVYIDITQKLALLPMAQSRCTIYKVHRHLRDINPKAYEPEILAIGPYHRDKDHLKMLEEHKLRYLRILVQRHGTNNVEMYVSAIGELEERARSCYAEPIDLSRQEFIEMLVLDGCFIIELIRKLYDMNLREENDPIFDMAWIVISLQRDLMLFENQIPFFILCKLFDLTEVPNQNNEFVYQILDFFYGLYPGEVLMQWSDQSPDMIKHLLDLIHNNMLASASDFINLGDGTDGARREGLQLINNTTELREASVKFKRNEGTSLFDISFKNGTLLLPPLRIDDRTESFFRNLIAYEQYFHDLQSSYVTDYVTFMDCLIDSSRDVEILSNCGIISNLLGDDKVVANMFNKLTDSVNCGEHFLQDKMIDEVNIYCNKWINKWRAKLRRNYWNSPWVVRAILVAVVLLLLTVTQTVFAILQVVLKF